MLLLLLLLPGQPVSGAWTDSTACWGTSALAGFFGAPLLPSCITHPWLPAPVQVELGAGPAQYRFFFNIGSVDAFERAMEDAQDSLGMDPSK